MKYPWANELFLSDHCTCHPVTARVWDNEVLSTHQVEWFGNPTTSAEFFVRQTYVASDCRWTSLKKAHLVCAETVQEPPNTFWHSESPTAQFRIGDAVLVHTEEMKLEPFIIECFYEENKTRYARMRRLLRRRDVDKTANSNFPPNELVYSQQLVEVLAKRIERHCLVRVFQVDEEITPPYNRGGTGDAFFITHEEVNGVLGYYPIRTPIPTLRQGFNPSPSQNRKKLQGLDLFCGGGNFGRGIEDSNVVDMCWAVDIWAPAINTYMANANANCTPFLRSVDDVLDSALKSNPGMPHPGDVHFISAGSPCPGFSLLTVDRTTAHQRKNQSLVASFASYVDFYRPMYGLLENVPKMVNSSKFRDSCVFSQLVCSLVGLGYQVQVMFLDAWAFGSAQNRTRVFIGFAAPGLQPLKTPISSHSHPPNTPLHRLGVMSNGRPFDSRERLPTPFKFVSMRDAVQDLPSIEDGKPDYCVGHPDHRLAIGISYIERKRLKVIPTWPYGMSFSKAWYGCADRGPVMTASERLLFPEAKEKTERVKKRSHGWGRIDPRGLVGTIPTKCAPTDARIGRINHWEQNRPISILEARRAQGFPDHEVLVGSPSDQYRIIGNSVSRHVALALGLAIREAWLGTLFDEKTTDIKIDIIQDMGAEVQAESDTVSEDPLIFTPSSFGMTTPDTSESAESSEGSVIRKRSRALYPLLGRKRQCSRNPSTTSLVVKG